MQRVALLGLLVGCATRAPSVDAPRRSEVVCAADALDRSTRHRELSISLTSTAPPLAILEAAERIEIPGLRVQYQSSSPTYANATWQIPAGSDVELSTVQAAMAGASVQSANSSESDYSPQVQQQCDRLRLLEEAAQALDAALSLTRGRAAEALLTERELNLRERQSQESSIRSLLDQSAFDRISVNVSLAQ
jgi:hypothetical protein